MASTTYDTVVNADTYFSEKMFVQNWTTASTATKTKALVEATQRIDRLRFRGYLVDEEQELEFPRYYDYDAGPDGTEEIPDDIKIACFELALALLNGVNPDKEVNNLAVTHRSFASVSTTYDRSMTLEHIASGIPSQMAWSYLKPYLAYTKSITIHRKS